MTHHKWSNQKIYHLSGNFVASIMICSTFWVSIDIFDDGKGHKGTSTSICAAISMLYLNKELAVYIIKKRII